MGYRPAGGGGGGPSTYFGDHVLSVAPAGQGAQFSSIQAAIDYADVSLPDGDGVGILVAPGYYDEDVILRRDNTHFNGLAGGLGGIVVKSMCVSDCTLASIANFRDPAHADKGDPTLLVRDAARFAAKAIPRTISFTNIRFGRRTNVPAWFSGTDGVWDPSTSKYNHDSALFSFSALGAPVAGTTFCGDVLAFISCVTDTAAGAVVNAPNGYYFCYAGNPVFLNSLMGDGVVTHNCGGCLLLKAIALSPLVTFYDATEAEPAGSARQGFGMLGLQAMAGVYAIGPNGNNGFSFGSTIDTEYKTEATDVTAFSYFLNTCINGNLEITNLGPSILMQMGRYSNPCAGAGAAGFTEVVGFGT
jgi:hypothetical protein